MPCCSSEAFFSGGILGLDCRGNEEERARGRRNRDLFCCFIGFCFLLRFYLIPFDVLLWLEGVQPEVVGK